MNWHYLAEHSGTHSEALTTFEALSPADGCWYDVRSLRKVTTKRVSGGSTWAAGLDGGTCLASWDGYGSDQDEVIEWDTVRSRSEPFDPNGHAPLAVGQRVLAQNDTGFWVDAEILRTKFDSSDNSLAHDEPANGNLLPSDANFHQQIEIQLLSRVGPQTGTTTQLRRVSSAQICVRPLPACSSEGSCSKSGATHARHCVLLHYIDDLPRSDLICELLVAGGHFPS